MNNLDSNYYEMIKKAIGRSNRSDLQHNTSFEELIYYDEYNNIILREIKYSSKDVTYEIHDNTYDQLGNLTIEKYTYIINNKAYAYEVKTFYEYVYDNENHIILRKTFNQDHRLSELIRNQYEQDKLIKKEVYINLNDNIDFTTGSDYIYKHLKKVHFYYYNEKNKLLQEKVCLPSGVISCYIIYTKTGMVERVENPFKSGYSWSIESICAGSYEISVKESIFNDEILKSIVDLLCEHYMDCHWILLDLSAVSNRNFNEEKVNDMMKLYGTNNNIIFNYI
ncbi:hypothetical protein [Anaerocolumna chitinilytica]|uniref:Uncharacterized protein n=1 Tax=Anaerocolumna chitinilytica TaxID=1727145 RepID=A0A7I8DK98_9FIRM|nr:hypothetical protein [Anaerocolumna chitinilytica]BCJ97455.1 hypothetical protein bsdcttw_04960 [Anaerocolumna chitinilytica]